MIATRNGIIKKCIVVDEITNQKYFLEKDEEYLTLYKRTKNGTEVAIEIFLVNNVHMTPEKFWGLVEKETKGEKLYISAAEFKKLSTGEQPTNIIQQTNGKIIDLKHNLKLITV